MSADPKPLASSAVDDGASPHANAGAFAGEQPLPVDVAPSPAAVPVGPAERIAAVDVLRGFALLGILTMNIVAFAWPFAGYEDPRYSGGDTAANRAAWFVNQTVFSAKMMTLFSMLFGAGLVLMADRAAKRGASVRGVYYRRTLWLLLIGLATSSSSTPPVAWCSTRCGACLCAGLSELPSSCW
jgi:uncharacterized protein